MSAPAAIPGAFTNPATDKTPFGKSGPTRPLAEIQKEFVKVLLSMSQSTAAPDVFRRFAGWVAYTVAADTAGMPCEPEDDGEAAKLAEWRKALCERRDGYARALEGLCGDWRDRSCRLMEIMGEGLEAAQGDFLSTVLERGLEGTNRWNGQFFTPSTVGLMMGRIIAPKPKTGWVETISDPCCGCGSLPISGVAGYLERGGRKDDVLVDVSDIDEGSVCACFVQCSAMGIACRAQAMDTLRLEPHGPMMVNPFYVLYGIQSRMKMQRAVEKIDEELRKAPKKPAEAPYAASGGGGATTLPPEAATGLQGASAGRNGPSPQPEGQILKKKAVPVQGTLF